MLDIGRIGLPHVGGRLRYLNGLPLCIAGEHFGVFLVEHRRVYLGHGSGNFLLAGPDVAQVHRLAILASAQRVAGQVQAYAAGQGIGHHQWRRGQPVGLDQRMHTAFEVAVTRQHRSHREVGAADGFFDRFIQRAGVADAGCAAIADQVEPQLVQIGGEPGGLEVVGDHLGARRQRTLDPGFALQAFLQGLFRHQPGGHHHTGVRGVGTRGDRGNHHGAIAQGVGLALMAVVDLPGLVGVAHRHAAATFAFQAADLFGQRFGLQFDEVVEGLADLAQGYPVLRPLGPGQAGLDLLHVQRQAVAEQWLLARLPPQALGFAVLLDQLHRRLGAAGQAQVVQGHLVDGEEAAGGTVFRGHVGDGCPVGQGQLCQAVAIELDELAHHALLAQHLRHRQHQVGGGDAFAQLAGQLEADHFRDQHRHRLAEHGRLRFDPAHAPAEHAEAVDHGGMRIGTDQGVGEGVGAAIGLTGPDGATEVFEVDLVANTSARRYHAEVVEGALAPAQEGIALAVALHFDVDVLAEGLRRAVAVDHHRMVDHQVHG